MSDEEFFDDFSGWSISDAELEGILEAARKTGDTQLRRLVKQNQYFRFLLRNLIDFADKNDVESVNRILNLARPALRNIEEKD